MFIILLLWVMASAFTEWCASAHGRSGCGLRYRWYSIRYLVPYFMPWWWNQNDQRKDEEGWKILSEI